MFCHASNQQNILHIQQSIRANDDDGIEPIVHIFSQVSQNLKYRNELYFEKACTDRSHLNLPESKLMDFVWSALQALKAPAIHASIHVPRNVRVVLIVFASRTCMSVLGEALCSLKSNVYSAVAACALPNTDSL